ncbi:MAG: WD40 repeat domain-containing serine/threonine protein kinase, partial [Planctomycetota bacterium]
MPETPEQIGPYTIRSEIGRGGMGIVYLAHDARLSRDVAIKALPDHVTDSRDRLARFEREARALASLSHPNVAQIYGVEESEGRRYLVLEYVPGETLDGVLKRERLPVGEALQVCAQVAAGLEAAHDAGVIHRDLKPANVRVSDDGVVKVLDFGLALTNDEPPASADGSSESPTMTSPVHSPTMPGVILGTAPYMSPEQARGKRVDRRTDIWSFGVVLYECLTGTGPFAGETATDSLGAVLHKDIDLDALPVQTPPLVRHVLQRCLERDKSRRLRDIGDARIELEHAQALPATTPGNAFPTTGRAGSPLLVASLAIIAVGLLVALLLTIMQPTPQADTPFVVASIAMPDGMRIDSSMALNQVTVSGDGRMLAYIARDDSGAATLFLRELGSVEPTRIADVPSPRGVTFSPDGRFIACCDENARLLRLRTDGGPPEVIADISAWGWPNGPLSWQDDGRIYFSPERDLGLWAVDVESGELSTVRGIDAEAGLWGILPAAGPSPRSGGMLVHTWGGFRRSGNEVSWLDLASGTVTRLLQRASHPFAIDDRWLVFTRDSSIMVIPFDFDALQPLGEARVVIEGVSASSWSTDSVFAAAPSGTAMYVPGGRRGLGRRIVSID